MSKTKKPPSQRAGYIGRYDLEMIRDFLDHLTWEVRILEHEATHPGAINPELVDQLSKYQTKRKTVGLLVTSTVSAEAAQADPEKFAVFRILQGKVRACQLAHLDALKSLFDEAFLVASEPNSLVCVQTDSLDDGIEQLKQQLTSYGVKVVDGDDDEDDDPPPYDDGYPRSEWQSDDD